MIIINQYVVMVHDLLVCDTIKKIIKYKSFCYALKQCHFKFGDMKQAVVDRFKCFFKGGGIFRVELAWSRLELS